MIDHGPKGKQVSCRQEGDDERAWSMVPCIVNSVVGRKRGKGNPWS